MYAFGVVVDGHFIFTQNRKEHIYTWPDEKTALEYFESGKRVAHLYHVEPDLSRATLVKRGVCEGEGPELVIPTETQQMGLFQSYIYKSLLLWSPPDHLCKMSS